MKTFRADLHIHTLLSPCGDLNMTPAGIIEEARNKGLDIIAITDHNSTLQAPLVQKLGAATGVTVVIGAEVTTREEIHCLALLPDSPTAVVFQAYLEKHQFYVKNDPEKFGDQVLIDEEENIMSEIDPLLITALDQDLDEVYTEVHRLGGLFIPAHVDKSAFSLVSQLGFIPPDLRADALELSPRMSVEDFRRENTGLHHLPVIRSSDAHFPAAIGQRFILFQLEQASFEEIRMALERREGRGIVYQEPL